jgi:hypothetical protein
VNETETRWYRWIADHSQYFFWAVWGAVAGALAFPGIVVAQTTTVFMDGNALYGECADNRPVYQGKELWPEFGDGLSGKGGISWGCSTPPLLHRRSDMPCPTIASSS